MAKSLPAVREADLRPYQTHFLFAGDTPFTLKGVASLLQQLPSVINHGIRDEADKCKVLQQANPRRFNGEITAWLVYRRTTPVTWAGGPEIIRDVEHHLVVLTARGPLLSVVATDKALTAKFSRGQRDATKWSSLERVSHRRLESALVHGTTRTLWLSGIHRSVATKPDSKVLIGPDVEASLDALGDQTYQYTSARCEGPEGALPTTFVGITPRLAKVWLGPSTDWEVFLANSRRLLRLVESVRDKGDAPYPVLARAHGSLAGVREAFDVSLAPPEYLYDEDPNLIQQLEALLQGATWAVRGEKGPNCVLTLRLADGVHKLKIKLDRRGDEVSHTVTPLGEEPPDEVKKIAALCQRPDLLRIFYESLHTYSDGQVFEVKTRPLPFPLTASDFSACDITLEKPEGPGGRRTSDLSRIGEDREPSLFTWVYKRWTPGWLWCDDGSGEIADFIHLDSDRAVLSLIHVKGALSASRNRGISVSAYEVVCSQALKNLRYTERSELEKPLKQKLMAKAHLIRCWRNGREVRSNSTEFWTAVEGVPYSKLQRRVVIVQPHVRKSSLPSDLSKDTKAVRQARLLYTLLHGIKADVNRYGVEFEVLVDR